MAFTEKTNQAYRVTAAQKMCTSKRQFRSRADARAFVRRDNHPDGKCLGYYECALCGKWHTTRDRAEQLTGNAKQRAHARQGNDVLADEIARRR